jgi:hypothetical protein
MVLAIIAKKSHIVHSLLWPVQVTNAACAAAAEKSDAQTTIAAKIIFLFISPINFKPIACFYYKTTVSHCQSRDM